MPRGEEGCLGRGRECALSEIMIFQRGKRDLCQCHGRGKRSRVAWIYFEWSYRERGRERKTARMGLLCREMRSLTAQFQGYFSPRSSISSPLPFPVSTKAAATTIWLLLLPPSSERCTSSHIICYSKISLTITIGRLSVPESFALLAIHHTSSTEYSALISLSN